MNAAPVPVVPSGIRWSAVCAGALVAWALVWLCQWLLPLVMSLNFIGAPREGYYRLMTFVAATVGGAVAARLGGRKSALHATLALAMQVALAMAVALAIKATRGHSMLAGFDGPYLIHAAWMVFFGYVGGSIIAIRSGERVAGAASIDVRAVVTGAAVAVAILMGFGLGSGIMWRVGQVVAGPVLVVGGIVAGLLAVRRGALHGAVAGALASAFLLIVSTYTLARYLPRMLETPGYWLKPFATTLVAIAAGAIGGLAAMALARKNP